MSENFALILFIIFMIIGFTAHTAIPLILYDGNRSALEKFPKSVKILYTITVLSVVGAILTVWFGPHGMWG